eukprot:12887440-Prorocentrum_lima.AAC.1
MERVARIAAAQTARAEAAQQQIETVAAEQATRTTAMVQRNSKGWAQRPQRQNNQSQPHQLRPSVLAKGVGT